MPKILIVLTSHADLMNTDSKSGVWIGEFTHPYYIFKDKGYDVVLASPQGGEPPVDPTSRLTEHITSHNRRFLDDEVAQEQFRTTFKLSDVNVTGFDALFFPGGHGPMFDLADDQVCADLILNFLSAHKPVAAVCHGPAALVKASTQKPDILSGKRVTGFSNTEETMVMKTNNVPFLLEDRLKELGGDYHSAAVPFTSHVEVDGLLITGQNPASAGPTADALVHALEGQQARA